MVQMFALASESTGYRELSKGLSEVCGNFGNEAMN